MKSNLKNSNSYTEARRKWAKGQTETVLNAMEQTGSKLGIKITPMQYVMAYKLCIEDYGFGYPAEYKIAELISNDETYGQVLAIMTEVMKRFRLKFQKEHKRQIKQMKSKTARKDVA